MTKFIFLLILCLSLTILSSNEFLGFREITINKFFIESDEKNGISNKFSSKFDEKNGIKLHREKFDALLVHEACKSIGLQKFLLEKECPSALHSPNKFRILFPDDFAH